MVTFLPARARCTSLEHAFIKIKFCLQFNTIPCKLTGRSIIKLPSNKNCPPRARAVLTTQKNEYQVGEEVRGEIQIISEEEFVSERVEVSLSCLEYLKKTRTVGYYGAPVLSGYGQRTEEFMDQARIYLGYSTVFKEALIPQGFNKKYSFVLKTPAAARETFYSIDNNVKWFVQTIVTVRGRPRLDTQTCEIVITKQQPVSQGAPAVSKEIIKEVVLIPCAYCGGLMPQTSLFCPNCGARRRA